MRKQVWLLPGCLTVVVLLAAPRPDCAQQPPRDFGELIKAARAKNCARSMLPALPSES